MLFKARFHAGLRDGSVDRTFRLWSNPKVRLRGQYRFARDGAVEVLAIDLVSLSKVTAREARRAGFSSRAELIAEIERASKRKLRRSDQLYRVRLRFVEPQESSAGSKKVTVTASYVSEVVARLLEVDRRSRSGAWTGEVLAWIGRNPKRRAGDLADRLGVERKALKARVRRLKALGLTQSHEVGYELTALGRGVVAKLKQ